jgi:hypothetical protein
MCACSTTDIREYCPRSRKLQESTNVDVAWPNLHSRWCMRHLGVNFYCQFRSKQLMDLFKKLCRQNQRCKFDEIWARQTDYQSHGQCP